MAILPALPVLPVLPTMFFAFAAPGQRFDLRPQPGAHAQIMATDRAPGPADGAALRVAAARDLAELALVIPEWTAAAKDGPADGQPHFLDLDRDGAPELALLDFTFFGPTQGFQFLAWDGTGFRFLFGAPGEFIGANTLGAHVFLRWEVPILAPGEPRVVRIIDCEPAARRCTDGGTLFVAAQTARPRPSAPRSVALSGATAPGRLRFAPKLDDTTPVLRSEDADGTHTATLGGNVVAEYPAGVQGTVFAERAGWAFVGFPAQPAPTRSSYVHGLFIRQQDEVLVPNPPPGSLYCGWLPASALTCVGADCLVGTWRRGDTCEAARKSREAWRFVRGGRPDADGVFRTGTLVGHTFRERLNQGPSGPTWRSGWRWDGAALWLGHDGAEETIAMPRVDGDTVTFDGGCLVRLGPVGR